MQKARSHLPIFIQRVASRLHLEATRVVSLCRLHSVVAMVLAMTICSARSSAEVDPLLQFIAAQQEATAQIFDRLSYSAVLKTATLESFSDELLRQTFVITIDRRGGSALFTCERSIIIKEIEQRENGKLIDPLFQVQEMPTVQRVLRTESFLASWPDVATPVVTLYRAKDWEKAPNDPREGILTIWHGADLRRHCFGLRNPLYKLIMQPENLARWEVSKEPGDNYRLNRWMAPGTPNERADLSIVVDGEFGLMHVARFTPPKSATECTAAYHSVEIAGRSLRLPAQVQSISHTIEQEVTNESRIEFFDYADHSKGVPFDLADFGMPEGTVLIEAMPSGVQAKSIWRGGELHRLAE